jgi:hypothetical protein
MNENAMPSPEGAGVAWFLKIDELSEWSCFKSGSWRSIALTFQCK